MKKIISLLSILAVFIFSAHAEAQQNAAPAARQNVNLSVTLKPFMDIQLSTQSVNFTFETALDYESEKVETIKDHLKINSTGGYEITVKTSSDNFNLPTGSNSNPLSTSVIKVSAAKGSNVNAATYTVNEVALSANPSKLVKSGKSGMNQSYEVSYKANGRSFLDKLNATAPTATTFTTTVTYEIVAS